MNFNFVKKCTLNSFVDLLQLNLVYIGQRWVFLAEKFKDCSTLGAKDVGTIEECQAVARTLGKLFSQVWNEPSFPKRCHLTLDNDNVYWNSHKIGGVSDRSSPICKDGWYTDS